MTHHFSERLTQHLTFSINVREILAAMTYHLSLFINVEVLVKKYFFVQKKILSFPIKIKREYIIHEMICFTSIRSHISLIVTYVSELALYSSFRCVLKIYNFEYHKISYSENTSLIEVLHCDD